MTSRLTSITHFMLFATLLSQSSAAEPTQETAEQRLILSIQRIWERAEHSAFTDLIVFRDRYYCCFREGSGHIPGLNGLIRVLESEDGENWRSVALLSEAGVDLRDPKLSITPEGRLCVNMGGSVYHGKTRLSMQSRVSFSDTEGRRFSAPQPIQMDAAVATGMDWLWRITWHQGAAWGAVQQVPPGQPRSLQLTRSEDAITWKHVHTHDVSFPSETTLRFLQDGRMLAIIRRSTAAPSVAWMGLSKPPFTDWQYRELDHILGGPNLIELPNGRWLVGGRNAERMTHLALLEWKTGRLQPVIDLPSGGDASYPGFVVEPKSDRLLVSYYSSHEGKTAIYLATLRLSTLQSW